MPRPKIAIIFSGNVYNRKGMVNAVISRIRYLRAIGGYDLTVYCVCTRHGWLARKLRHSSKVATAPLIVLDGVEINILWHSFSVIDYVLGRKLRSKPIFLDRFKTKSARLLQGYDLVSAHFDVAGHIAAIAKERYGVPYCITWHGSDINLLPFTSSYQMDTVKKTIENADCNFFVSRALMQRSDSITPNGRKMVLYNGVSERFFRYDDATRTRLRREFNVDGYKIVAFVGNLVAVKNVTLLPEIFQSIAGKYGGKVLFWVIGDGDQRHLIEPRIKSNGNIECKFWGNQPVERMPDFMNCIDLLVLPSQNEGLPLVTVESIKCGANVVGSDVGGIKEAIGEENVFPLGEDFINQISDRAVYMLQHYVCQQVPAELSWENTARLENDCYMSLLNK